MGKTLGIAIGQRPDAFTQAVELVVTLEEEGKNATIITPKALEGPIQRRHKPFHPITGVLEDLDQEQEEIVRGVRANLIAGGGLDRPQINVHEEPGGVRAIVMRLEQVKVVKRIDPRFLDDEMPVFIGVRKLFEKSGQPLLQTEIRGHDILQDRKTAVDLHLDMVIGNIDLKRFGADHRPPPGTLKQPLPMGSNADFGRG